MIGDANGEIARRFGVIWPVIGKPRRVTFVVDREGIVRSVFWHEFQISRHLDDTLHLLRKLAAGQGD